MAQKLLIGVFSDDQKMVKAAEELKAKNISIFDIYTPFPMHIDHLLDIQRSRLPYVTLGAGLLGLTIALTAQYWISVIEWPIIVGGKSFNSFPAFIPVAFEVTILLGAFLTAIAFFLRVGLAPTLNAKIVHPGATQDRFVIALDANQVTSQQSDIEALFRTHGALEVEVKEV